MGEPDRTNMASLDIRTLVLTSALIAAALATLSFLFSRDRSAPALRIWAWGLVALTGGLLAHAGRGAGLPELAGVVFGNGLIFTAMLAAYRATASLTGRKVDDPIDVYIVTVGVVGLVILHFTISDLRPRGALFSIIAVVLLARTAFALHATPASRRLNGRTLTLIVLYVWAGLHLMRAVYFSASPPWETFDAASAATVATFLVTSLFAVAATLGVACMQWSAMLADRDPVEGRSARTDEPAIRPPRVRPEPDDGPTRHTVFLVDDNPDFLSVTAYALEAAGYRVLTARSGDEASRAILLRRSKPDVVVTDVVMPGRLSGIGLAQELRADYPWMAIILLTGYPRSVLTADARGFVVAQKPVTIDALVRVIETERARGEGLRPAAAARPSATRPPSARASDR